MEIITNFIRERYGEYGVIKLGKYTVDMFGEKTNGNGWHIKWNDGSVSILEHRIGDTHAGNIYENGDLIDDK